MLKLLDILYIYIYIYVDDIYVKFSITIGGQSFNWQQKLN